METRFKSLKRTGVAYELLNWENRMDNYKYPGTHLSGNIAEYQCYDDGLVRHSGWGMVCVDNMLDCLASLAVFMIENHSEALMKMVSGFWPTEIYHKDIDFAMTVKFREGKRSFCNMGDQKLSTSEKLQHDKRWMEVPSYATGNLDSVLNLLVKSYSDALERLAMYIQVRSYIFDKTGWLQNVEGHFIGNRDDDINNLHAAMSTITGLVDAQRRIESAGRSLDCLRHNWIDKPERDIQYEKITGDCCSA